MSEGADAAQGGMNLVTKSAAVLAAIAEHGELTVAELAEHTGEPASSLYRLLSSLDAVGWTEPGSKRGRVRIGLAFLRLGERLEGQLDLRRLALPELERLQGETGETAFLCIRRGLRAVCIERIDGLDVQIHALLLGDSLPLGEGVAPRSILAFETPELVERYFREGTGNGTHSSIAPGSPEELRRLLDETARVGAAVAESEFADGIGGVGAPIFNYKGHVVGALSISGLSGRIFSGTYDAVALVKGAAGRISTALGAGLAEGKQ